MGKQRPWVSFEETQELLRELAGVEVPTKQVERSAEALGREIAEEERPVVEPPTVEEAVMPTRSSSERHQRSRPTMGQTTSRRA